MKDMVAAIRILGIDISRNRTEGTLFLSRESYISKVLNRFRMTKSKPVNTPLEQHFKLSASQAPKDTGETEHDSGSICKCNRKLRVLKWILRYINGTRDIGIKFTANVSASKMVKGFVDSHYAGCLDTRKSLSGYILQHLMEP